MSGKLGKSLRVCCDLLILAVLVSVWYAIHKWWQPTHRGFFCDDESLRYPRRDDTINMPTLIVLLFPAPFLLFVVAELTRRRTERRTHGSFSKKMAPSDGGYRLAHRLAQCYHQLLHYIFGLGLTLIATEIAKFACGRLRPHFHAVCQPQFANGTTCSDPINQGRYLTDYVCSNRQATEKELQDIHLSFPSGHSSAIFFAMVYLAQYVQDVLRPVFSNLLRHLVQFSLMAVAWYVSLTRISDYWHHWSDVLVGAALGTLIAYAIGRFVAALPMYTGPNAEKKSTGKVAAAATSTATPTMAAPTNLLPAYTFGTMPYLHYAAAPPPPPPAAHHQYATAQTFHNYGYVP